MLIPHLDKAGRPATKVCPDCDDTLGRTARRCPNCGHVFIGRQYAQRKRGPVYATPRTCADDQFDCIAMPDGGLRLCMPDGEVILTRRQREIIALELVNG